MAGLKWLVHAGLRKLGYELAPARGRNSLAGVLANARKNGLHPATVIDVGAGRGDFSRLAAEIFPDAAVLMIEPLSEFADALRAMASSIGTAHVVAGVAAAADGQLEINVHDDLFGSSLLCEEEGAQVDGKPRTIAAHRLDTLVAQLNLRPPFLIKADVQGAELAVLEGAPQALASTDFILLETSFFRFFKGGPLLHEVIAGMAAKGFVPYDLLGLAHRPLDGALAQADMAFVREDSPLRRQHHYATPEQRTAITKRLRA